MKTVTSVLFLAALAGGCVHRRVVVESHAEPVYDDGGYAGGGVSYEDDPYYEDDFVDGCDPVWDGHAFIVIENTHVHGDGCGHFFHHNYWHLYPAHHVYFDVGYSHCGDHGDFIRSGVHWTRVWDGCSFVMLCRHVHGPGCGHYFHSGCWHVHPQHHVYASHRSRHFEKECEVAAAPRRRTYDRDDNRGQAARNEAGPRHGSSGGAVMAPSRSAEPRASRSSRSHAGSESRSRSTEAPVREAGPGRRVEAPREPERRDARPEERRREVRPGREAGQPERLRAPGLERSNAPQRVERPQREAGRPERVRAPERGQSPQRVEKPQRESGRPERVRAPARDSRQAPQRVEKPRPAAEPAKQRSPEATRRPERPKEPEKKK